MMTLGIVLTVLVLLLIALFLVLRVLPAQRPSASLLHGSRSILLVFLPMIWVGWKTMQRRRWALWTGFALALCGLVLVVTTLFGYPEVDIGVDAFNRPEMRLVFDLFIALLGAVQFLLYWAALVSFYANRQQPHGKE